MNPTVFLVTAVTVFEIASGANYNHHKSRYPYANSSYAPLVEPRLDCVQNYACNVKGTNLLGWLNISTVEGTSLQEVRIYSKCN